MQNNGNPQQLLQQVMENISPEQREGILRQARNYRCTRKYFSTNTKYEVVNNVRQKNIVFVVLYYKYSQKKGGNPI